MEPRPLKNIIKLFAVFGAVIPIALLVIKYIELYIDSQKVPYAGLYGFYLWPTSILLLGLPEGFSARGTVWLVVSILLNSGLYALVGLLADGMSRLLWKRQ
jgi:hypothetical protein